MTAAIVALAAALAGAVGGLISLAVSWARAERRIGLVAVDLTLARARVTDAEAAAEQAKAQSREDTARFERVVGALKAEAHALSEDLDGCLQDPGVVRDRLRRLLAVPEGGRAASAPTGGAPSRVPASPGT